MKLLPIKEACKKANISDMTIRNWIQEGKLKKYEDDKGVLLIEQRELLESLPTIITFFNQKGGVAKTDSCMITSDYYEKKYEKQVGKKILLVDLDPQSTLSYNYFADKELYGEKNEKPSLYNFIENSTPLNKIVRSYNNVIDLLPAHIDMMHKTNLDTTDLIPLKNEFISLFKKYTLVLIDCPPAVNALSRLGVILSQYILCPLLPTDNCYRASASALLNIQKIVEYNKDFIDYRCFISSNSSQKINVKDYVVEKYKEDIGQKIFNNQIPEFVGVIERESLKENIFKRYPSTHQSIMRIIKVMEEIDNLIYDMR